VMRSDISVSSRYCALGELRSRNQDLGSTTLHERPLFPEGAERYQQSAICFCDIPEADLTIHMGKYGPFGLAFTKKFLMLPRPPFPDPPSQRGPPGRQSLTGLAECPRRRRGCLDLSRGAWYAGDCALSGHTVHSKFRSQRWLPVGFYVHATCI
jgi:hypothetical protein